MPPSLVLIADCKQKFPIIEQFDLLSPEETVTNCCVQTIALYWCLIALYNSMVSNFSSSLTNECIMSNRTQPHCHHKLLFNNKQFSSVFFSDYYIVFYFSPYLSHYVLIYILLLSCSLTSIFLATANQYSCSFLIIFGNGCFHFKATVTTKVCVYGISCIVFRMAYYSRNKSS